MTPVQPNELIHAVFDRTGLSVAIPIYRLLFANRDTTAVPGGLFRTEDGSFAVVVDSRLSAEAAAEQARAEIARHWAELDAAVVSLGRSPAGVS